VLIIEQKQKVHKKMCSSEDLLGIGQVKEESGVYFSSFTSKVMG